MVNNKKSHALLIFLCLTWLNVLAAEAKKPNILFILADDMAFDVLGSLQVTPCKTPAIDKLMDRGTQFTHAYNMGAWNGAVCMASRSMLNSGCFLHQANEGVQKHPQWSALMQSAGYSTYMTGKWHLPVEPDFTTCKDPRPGMPNLKPPIMSLFKNGFYIGPMDDIHEGYDRPHDMEDYQNGWKPWDKSKEGFWEGGTHWSEIVADNTIDFLKQASKDENPFFMYVAFNAPHDPRQAPKEFIDMYPLDEIEVPCNFAAQYPYRDAIGSGWKLRDEFLAPFPRTPFSIKVNLQEYYAIITHMDRQIARILEALKKTGKEDNTIIIFTADHGLGMGRHGLVGKQNMYDHSMRVPFIISGPQIKPLQKFNTPIYLQDAMATSLDLAGIKKPEHVKFKSLLPIINGEKSANYKSIYGSYITHQRMIIEGDWKLMAYPYAKKLRLFNLASDPYETNDLSEDPSCLSKLNSMKVALKKLQNKMGDSLDIDNPPPEDYDNVPNPMVK